MNDDRRDLCPHCQLPLEIEAVRFGLGGSALTWACPNCTPEQTQQATASPGAGENARRSGRFDESAPPEHSVVSFPFALRGRVARANIDKYIEVLGDCDLAPETRAIIVKLLIEEESKLARDLEQLEFAENRAGQVRDRLNYLRRMRDVALPDARARAEQLVTNFEAIQDLLDGFCQQLRSKVNSQRS